MDLVTLLCYGGYIKKNNVNLKKISNIKIFVITIILITVTILYEVFFSKRFYGNCYAENFYQNPLVIGTSFCIFILISKLNFTNKMISNVASVTMGIYILHLLILNTITKIWTFNNNYFCILNTLIVFFISYIISIIISKLPFISKMIKV